MPELHAISTGKQLPEEWLRISLAIVEEVDYLHLREKSWTFEQKKKAVGQLLEAGVPKEKVIVNNEPRIREALQLGGVQFPEKAEIEKYRNRNWRLGVSVHDSATARQREAEGADYLIFGHIYETASKPGLPARGLSSLEKLIQAVSLPVIAIGGITPERTAACISAGAAGVAVLSGIYEAEDPKSSAKAYKEALSKGEGNGSTL